jgi:membrane-bound ClpP family serine protease
VKFESTVSRATPALLVFVALTLGFSVADLTDIRWLGGLVMIVIGAVAVFLMNRKVGLVRTLIGVVVVVAGFILSHALGSILGSYGALFFIATACAVVIFMLTSVREDPPKN